MNIVNTEMIIESLLGIGFDKVDSIFLTLVTGKIVLDKKNNFNFQDEKLSDFFSTNIKHDGFCFKIKDKRPSSYEYANKEANELLLLKLRNQNTKLTEYLEKIDYSEIIFKKIELLGINDFNECIELFSNKEIKIIKEFYNAKKALFTKLYNEETISTKKSVKTLEKQKKTDK